MSDDNFTAADQLTIQRVTATDPDTRFNIDCNKVFLQGEERFGDFESVSEKLAKTGVGNREVLEQVLGADDPAKVLHLLSQDEETAKLIAGMSPVKRAGAIYALERGQPIPQHKTPAWRAPPSQKHEDDLDDLTWNRMNKAGKLPRMRGDR